MGLLPPLTKAGFVLAHVFAKSHSKVARIIFFLGVVEILIFLLLLKASCQILLQSFLSEGVKGNIVILINIEQLTPGILPAFK